MRSRARARPWCARRAASAGRGRAMASRCLAWIGRGWRVLATGTSFALFGIGGLLLRVLAFPLLALCIRERTRRVRAARGLIRLSFRAFVGIMRLLGVLRYEVHGLHKL